MLTDKQEKFALGLLAGLTRTEAYRRAYGCEGWAAKSVWCEASKLAAHPEVVQWIRERKMKAFEKVDIQVADVLRELWMVATADPNELVYVRRNCCRYCHGFAFGYQWRDLDEYGAACERAIANDQTPPEFDGGDGFDERLDPNPDCPRCHGVGVADVVVADTRLAEGPARRLLAGIKQTKDGIELKFRDQDAALRDIGRHLGMFNDKLHLPGVGANGASSIPDSATVEGVDASTAARIYRDVMG